MKTLLLPFFLRDMKLLYSFHQCRYDLVRRAVRSACMLKHENLRSSGVKKGKQMMYCPFWVAWVIRWLPARFLPIHEL